MELQVGRSVWSVSVPPEKAVELHRVGIPSVPTGSPRELVRAALEKPFGFESLRRALTPDDRVTIVVEDELPQLGELLAGVLEHLQSAGIEPSCVTVLTPPDSAQTWIDELPDEFAEVIAESHDPANAKKLAYLASTQAGRRVYMNRTLVEGDFIIILTGRGYDPQFGYSGAEAAVFPALGDQELRAQFEGKFSKDAPGADPWPVRVEAAEVAWLLGTPFLVQVIPGADNTIQAVVAGLLDSGAEGIRQHDARWRSTIDQPADTVIATIGGESERVSFLDLARAAACAARVVAKGGRIAILSQAAPALGPGAEMLRQHDDPASAIKAVAKEHPADWAACYLWCRAAKKAGSLYLASNWPDQQVEELFATPLRDAGEAQRLIDASPRVLVIPDAHRSLVTL